MEIVILSIVLVLVFITIGMPVTFCFLAGALVYYMLTGGDMGALGREAFYALNIHALLAVPLFMLAGALMEISGIATRLIDFSRALIGKAKGGMGAIIPVSSMFFGALSGSGTATVAALSAILIPRMSKLGWDKRYSAALLAASGPLGFMIPPNMSAILYGIVTNTSISALFLATVIPGIIWGGLYLVINRFVYTKWHHPEKAEDNAAATAEEQLAATNYQKKKYSYFSELYKTSIPAIPAFIMPIIIFVGIYGGIFTATEAGAVACIYALIAGLFIFKTVKLKNGYHSFIETGISLGSFMLIIPMVMILTRILVLNGVPKAITNGLNSITSNEYMLILLICIVFVIAGLFLDPGVLVFVLAPLLLPTATSIGMDPIQFGVILFVSIGIGAITPPLALNLFVVARISKTPVQDIIKPLLPFFLFGALPVLLLVAYIPALSLWLPNLIR